MIHIKFFSGLLALALTAPAIAQDINFTTPQSYPESFTYSSKQNVVFLGSVRQGLVAKLQTNGDYTTFIEDNRLVSTAGLLVDDARNVLWVTNSDPGAGERTAANSQGKLAAIATFDATSGAPLDYFDLGGLSEGAHFANDIALDGAGNVYVTDSFSPLIYKIDTEGTSTVFASNPVFFTEEGFNLNGIAWHKDGYLLVGKYNTGQLFRISTSNPNDIQEVRLTEALVGADGIHLIDGEHMVVAQNMGADRIVELVSTDGWTSARVVRTEPSLSSMPTAAASVGSSVFVLNSRLDTLFDPAAHKVGDYILQEF